MDRKRIRGMGESTLYVCVYVTVGVMLNIPTKSIVIVILCI